jgi:hypothetical protein
LLANKGQTLANSIRKAAGHSKLNNKSLNLNHFEDMMSSEGGNSGTLGKMGINYKAL